MAPQSKLYEQDFYAWTQETAARLRGGAWDEVALVYLLDSTVFASLTCSKSLCMNSFCGLDTKR